MTPGCRWLVICVLCSLSAGFARAEAPLQLVPGKLLTVGNERGYWWPLATAEALRAEHLELPQLRTLLATNEELIALLKQRLVEKDTRFKQLQFVCGLSEARALVAEDAISAAMRSENAADKRAREAEESARAWYRHPALWFSAGAVFVAGAAGAGFAALN